MKIVKTMILIISIFIASNTSVTFAKSCTHYSLGSAARSGCEIGRGVKKPYVDNYLMRKRACKSKGMVWEHSTYTGKGYCRDATQEENCKALKRIISSVKKSCAEGKKVYCEVLKKCGVSI